VGDTAHFQLYLDTPFMYYSRLHLLRFCCTAVGLICFGVSVLQCGYGGLHLLRCNVCPLTCSSGPICAALFRKHHRPLPRIPPAATPCASPTRQTSHPRSSPPAPQHLSLSFRSSNLVLALSLPPVLASPSRFRFGHEMEGPLYFSTRIVR